MKILFVSSEVAPYSKSGGLADVAYSLPPALKASGDEVAVISPLYQCVRKRFGDTLTLVENTEIRFGENMIHCGLYRGEMNGVTMWFLEDDDLFDRPKLYGYDDDKYRFAYFSRAVIELLPKLDFMPDILHCNDWETALAVIYLKNDQTWRTDLQGIRTVYTIHNIAYQGQFGASDLTSTFKLPEGWYNGGLGYEYQGRHDINLMKGAMMMSDAVSTVSQTYAKELHYPEFGRGLQGVADMIESKMYGILNGIDMDLYDPAKDTRLVANFTVDDLTGKAACKEHIQEMFGMSKKSRWPMLCSVARLNEQKGIELIMQIMPALMRMGIQLVVFGQGEQRYIDYFNWAKQQWPGQLGFSSDYTEQVAAEIFAGADMYLMPSRFEPCGLSQMMAMRYGTIPIVHETGGLKDSVRPYNDFDGFGDGFSFGNYEAKELYQAIFEAVRLYYGKEDVFALLRHRCMTKDFSWTKSAEQYNRMYGEIADGGDGEPISFEDAFAKVKEAYLEREAANRQERLDEPGLPADYSLVCQVQITGRGAGVFYVDFRKDKFIIEPLMYEDCDVKIATSLDNLVGMCEGTVSADKLFMTGQLKVEGNVARGHNLKWFLHPDQETFTDR